MWTSLFKAKNYYSFSMCVVSGTLYAKRKKKTEFKYGHNKALIDNKSPIEVAITIRPILHAFMF